MHALHTLPPGARAESRGAAIETAGRQWLEAQGARCGFAVPKSGNNLDDDSMGPSLRIDGYRVLRPPRPSKGPQMRIAVLEFEGVLTVIDPNVFLAALVRGFGRAKAYGCGLMLIARI
jgi:CRISPR system Cascade subunit CasE